MSKRPFFSVIIACYNDGRYKEGVYLDRLLNSICSQFLKKEEIEVVLADDCSPVPFAEEYIEKYSGFLTMKYIKTDYNFAPGNTREKGVSIATGEWICFADHDDAFVPMSFIKVREALQKTGEQRYLITDFNEVKLDGSTKQKFVGSLNWCHGKFYNMDNLWKKEDIHFVKDLRSHEDIAICSQVNCVIQREQPPHFRHLNELVYLWTENPQSLSHVTYIDKDAGDGYAHTFLETHFNDYIESTGYITLDKFSKGLTSELYAKVASLEVLCYCYFYMQGFQWTSGKNYLKCNWEYAANYYKEMCRVFDWDGDKVRKQICDTNAALYWRVRKFSEVATGPRIDSQTFAQWLTKVEEYAKFPLK